MPIFSLYFIFFCSLSSLCNCLPKKQIINSFQTKTFSLLSSNNSETNIVFSPLSLYQALSLVSNGARGKTEYEIIFALDNTNQVDQNIYNFKLLNKNRTSIVLANAVLSKFAPSDLFLQVSNKYKAFISELISVEQVNEWCNEQTKGTIPTIIDDISNVVLIVLNAVYFKGEWKHKFQSYMTYVTSFTNINNTQVNVNMMKQLNQFNYYEDSIVQVFELEYKEDDLSAIVILPQEQQNINAYIENNLNEATLLKYYDNMIKQKIEIHLPKFSIESSFTLNNILQQIGIKRAFNSTTADFGIITPHGDLYISSVVQKAFLKVDEEGTEASAVTAVMFDESIPMVQKKVIVNRPFLFIIKDNKFSKNHPFIAKVVNLQNDK